MPDLWLGPDVNRDLLELQSGSWPIARSRCAVVQGYIQQLYANAENEGGVGPNYYPRLAGAGYYSDLGIPHAAEGPVLKEWDTDPDGGHRGRQAAEQLVVCLDRIRAAGSDLSYESLDSSLLARVALGMSLDAAADAVAHVIQTAHAHGLARVGLTEAYPATPFHEPIAFANALEERLAQPSHLHLDMDVYAFADRRMPDAQIRGELQWLQTECAARGMWFGIIINGGRVQSQYREYALNTVRRLPTWFDMHLPDRLILQSFEQSAFPPLVPETDPISHTGLLVEVAKLLGGQGVNSMWVPVTIDGKTLLNPDGTRRSLFPAYSQPVNGTYGPYHWEAKQPTEPIGPFETFEQGSGAVSYNPTGKEPVVYGFQPAGSGFLLTVDPLPL